MTWAAWVGSIGSILGGLAMLWSAAQQRRLNQHEKTLKELTE